MKGVIKVGYTRYVVDAAKALSILESLESAEVWDEKYHSAKSGEPSNTTYHVYSKESEARPTELKLITDELYRLAKLAGKPPEE